jgi:hypothetical protein
MTDLDSKTVIHQFDTDQQCQDVAFVDGYAVVFARTNHIKKGAEAVRMFSKKWGDVRDRIRLYNTRKPA